MTKLQENQEYILTKIYEKRPISKYGLEYVVDTYFPEKLEAME